MGGLLVQLPTLEQFQPIILSPDVQAELAPHRANDFDSLMEMMKDMRRPKLAPPKNPCQEDMARTGCKDALCLKRYAEKLSGTCAELLLKEPKDPEPSPAPMSHSRPLAELISHLLGKDEEVELKPSIMLQKDPSKRLNVEARRRAESAGEGFFQMTSVDEEGHAHTTSGPISATMPPELASMVSMLPDIGNMLGELGLRIPTNERAVQRMAMREERPAKREEYPTASIGGISFHEDEESKEDTSHPCNDEIDHCRDITGSSASEVVKKCLLANFDKLSAKCKCFIHQVEGDRAVPSSMKAAPAPVVHVAAVPDVVVRVTETEFDEPIRRHQREHGPCVFFSTLMLIAFALVLRQCFLCCCARPPASTMAVVVPPEHTTIKLVEPLVAADIKKVEN